MAMIAHRLNLRCLIDGIEVPVIAARATFSEGAPATAEIQLVATDEVYDILPRAFVTLFFYETYDFDRTPSSSVEMLRLPPKDLRRWKLLFSGEYIQISFQKEAGGRACSIVCADLTNYWDFIKQYYINFANGGIELFENAFLGVKNDRIKNYDVIGKDMASNLFVWLTKSKGPDGKPNIYLGVQRILREMWFASSDFYAKAFNRTRAGDQIVGVPGDQTAAKLFQLEFFKKFIENQIGGGGDEVTARGMVEALLGNVFHTYVTVPCPFFDRTGKARGFSPTSGQAQDDALLSENIDRSNSWPESSLNSTIIKPDTWFTMPPACNVVFPHQYTSISFQRNFLQEPTRMFLRTNLLFGGTNDKWLTERFYAPDFETFNQQLYKEGGYYRRMSSTLLEHEEFVGINAVQAWTSDMGAYAQKGKRREYLARVADYLFWKMRFAPRSANVSGPFNPNIVPGYPGLVINNVSRPGQATKHYLGNIQTVTHVISQAEGGWTHFTMAGAHVHDETIDFDKKGRSLEEVANRGADGFIDDRYDSTRIGPEVYQTLFGCDSIFETYLTTGTGGDDPLSLRLSALQAAGAGDTILSVEAIHGLYQTAVREKMDLNAFSQSISWRPKANMLEMLGVQVLQASGTGAVVTDLIDFNKLNDEDPELVVNDGFFASCTDPEASTTVDATFVAVKSRSVGVTTTTSIPEISESVGDADEERIIQSASTVTSTTYKTVTEKSTGNYELAAHLEARRAKVLAYTESLKYRGLRG